MKVIFWDVDGVLNYPSIWGAWSKLGWSEAICPILVARAYELVKETGAKCVLSSTWRLSGYERTLECLEQRGWPTAKDDFIGATPHLGMARGCEIGEWLVSHPDVETFVIVDDSSDMTTHMRRLVRTDPTQGLSAENCESIRVLLSPNGTQARDAVRKRPTARRESTRAKSSSGGRP